MDPKTEAVKFEVRLRLTCGSSLCQEEWECESIFLAHSGPASMLLTRGLKAWAAGEDEEQKHTEFSGIRTPACAQNLGSVPREGAAGIPSSPSPLASNNSRRVADGAPKTAQGKGTPLWETQRFTFQRKAPEASQLQEPIPLERHAELGEEDGRLGSGLMKELACVSADRLHVS